MMNLFSFFYDFTTCPFCNCHLAINIIPNNIESENTVYTPRLEDTKFIINVDTSRFVVGKQHSYISIDLSNGIISQSKNVSNFIDLYELNLQIRIFCDKSCTFMRKINFSYDYKGSKFFVSKHSDGFAFILNDTRYSFFNYYDENQSKFSKTKNDNNLFDSYMMPIMDLKSFEYNKDKLAKKFDNLTILT